MPKAIFPVKIPSQTGVSSNRDMESAAPVEFVEVQMVLGISNNKGTFEAGVVKCQAEILEDIHHPLLLRGGAQHLVGAGGR